MGDAPPPSPQPRKRSASTLRNLVRASEKRIRDIERRRDALVADLADAGDDHRKLAEIGAALAAAEAQLHQAEDEWLTLSEEAGA